MQFMKTSFNALSYKALIAVVIALLPLPVSFLFSYGSSEKHLRVRILNDLAVVNEAHEGQVYQFLAQAKIRAADFASDGFIRDHVNGAGPKSALNDHLLRNKKGIDRTIRNIYIAATNGRVVGSTDPKAIGRSLTGKEWFEGGKEATTVIDDGDRLLAASPLTSRTTGAFIGVLVNEIPLSELDKVISGVFTRERGALSWKSGRPRTMEAYIVDHDRRVIASSGFAK